MRCLFSVVLTTVLVGVVATAAGGQELSIEVETIGCLPSEANAMVTADVLGDIPGGEVRLYLRRLNAVGGFYWVRMEFDGASYWSTFPKPEDHEPPELTDEWWEVLATRDWMEGRDRDWLEDWLEGQDSEAAEYYVALYDSFGQVRGRSRTFLVEVRDDCASILDLAASRLGDNMTLGETSVSQSGRSAFHWLCDGIVTRVDTEGIWRADESCRECIVASVLPDETNADRLADASFQFREAPVPSVTCARLGK